MAAIWQGPAVRHGCRWHPAGWQDLLTGECTVEVPEGESDLRAALSAYAARYSSDDCSEPVLESLASASPETAAAASFLPVVATTVEDLAQRRAGAAAREQAVALRKAAPVSTTVARLFGIHTDERAWRIGANGEEEVATELAKLIRKDPGWRILHAVPVGKRGSDVDHVILGPGGVFTFNAKHHPGAKLWVAENAFPRER